MSTAATGVVIGDSQVNANALQNESWYDVVGPLTTTFANLIPNQVYKVSVYNDRDGFLGASTTYSVNGSSKTLPFAGAAPTVLPGVENTDYATFIIKASATGTVTVIAQVIAAIQVQGVLTGETGPQADCLITKSRSSLNGKGNGTYGIKFNRAQSLSLSSGGKAQTYYVNVQNEGSEIDNFFLMALHDTSKAKVKVTDLTTRANVTTQARLRKYRYDLDVASTRRFKVIVRGTSGASLPLSAPIGASPSTLKSAKQDVVTCILAP